LEKTQVHGEAQVVGPVHPSPPHFSQCWATPPFPPAVVVVRTGVVVVRLLVVVVRTDVVVVRTDEVVVRLAVEVVRLMELVVVTDPPSGLTTFCHGKVELIGPHLISEKMT